MDLGPDTSEAHISLPALLLLMLTIAWLINLNVHPTGIFYLLS